MEINVEVLIILVAQKLDAFCCYHVDVDNYKCALFWWHREQRKFSTCSLVRQVLGIPTSQIETKRIFSIVGIPIAL